RALRSGLQAPRIALDDEIPELALLLSILPGEAQLHPLPPARLRVLADMDPLRPAHELRDAHILPRQRLGDLDAAAPGADDAPAQRTVLRKGMIPARRVEPLAGEAVLARDVGQERLGQKPGGDDEEIDDIGLARRRLQMPL